MADGPPGAPAWHAAVNLPTPLAPFAPTRHAPFVLGLGELVCIVAAVALAIVGPLVAIVIVMRLRGRRDDEDE